MQLHVSGNGLIQDLGDRPSCWDNLPGVRNGGGWEKTQARVHRMGVLASFHMCPKDLPRKPVAVFLPGIRLCNIFCRRGLVALLRPCCGTAKQYDSARVLTMKTSIIHVQVMGDVARHSAVAGSIAGAQNDDRCKWSAVVQRRCQPPQRVARMVQY